MKITEESDFKFYGIFILVILITVGWAVFFYFVPPSLVVQKIGIQNSYLVAFIVSTIAGFSSISGSTYYVTIAALSKGGANPGLIGLSGGLGVALSDFLFFYVMSKGATEIDKRWKKFADFMKKTVERLPPWALYILVFVYSAVSPFPNDILLVAIALAGIPFKKIAPYLFVGDIISTLIVAYLAH